MANWSEYHPASRHNLSVITRELWNQHPDLAEIQSRLELLKTQGVDVKQEWKELTADRLDDHPDWPTISLEDVLPSADDVLLQERVAAAFPLRPPLRIVRTTDDAVDNDDDDENEITRSYLDEHAFRERSARLEKEGWGIESATSRWDGGWDATYELKTT